MGNKHPREYGKWDECKASKKCCTQYSKESWKGSEISEKDMERITFHGEGTGKNGCNEDYKCTSDNDNWGHCKTKGDPGWEDGSCMESTSGTSKSICDDPWVCRNGKCVMHRSGGGGGNVPDCGAACV